MTAAVFTRLLQGRGAHVATPTLFDGLDWRLAGERAPQDPYSIWQLLQHMIYWQDFILAQLRGEAPPAPEHAEAGWPGGEAPVSEEAWREAVARFKAGLQEAERQVETELGAPLAARPSRSRAENLAALASHNSYHGGQVVLVRRVLGAWPPPTGGDTW